MTPLPTVTHRRVRNSRLKSAQRPRRGKWTASLQPTPCRALPHGSMPPAASRSDRRRTRFRSMAHAPPTSLTCTLPTAARFPVTRIPSPKCFHCVLPVLKIPTLLGARSHTQEAHTPQSTPQTRFSFAALTWIVSPPQLGPKRHLRPRSCTRLGPGFTVPL